MEFPLIRQCQLWPRQSHYNLAEVNPFSHKGRLQDIGKAQEVTQNAFLAIRFMN
jgi:hypothetical protein